MEPFERVIDVIPSFGDEPVVVDDVDEVAGALLVQAVSGNIANLLARETSGH